MTKIQNKIVFRKQFYSAAFGSFEFSGLVFVSDFDIRISDFDDFYKPKSFLKDFDTLNQCAYF